MDESQIRVLAQQFRDFVTFLLLFWSFIRIVIDVELVWRNVFGPDAQDMVLLFVLLKPCLSLVGGGSFVSGVLSLSFQISIPTETLTAVPNSTSIG